MIHLTPMVALFAQRPPADSSFKKANQPTQPPVVDKSADYYIGGAAAALVFIVVFWFARRRWLKLRPTIGARSGVVTERDRPGFLAENLAAERWEKSLAITLKGAESALLADGSPISAKASAAIREVVPLTTTLAAITRQAATSAIESGEVQTRLLSTSSTTIFALVCPSRHAHVRLLRKSAAFADGWLEYAAQLQRGLDKNGSRPDVLCLLLFLSPDARDGSLAIAFDTAEGRLATAELVDGDTGGDDRPLRRVGGWGFQLAGLADERATS